MDLDKAIEKTIKDLEHEFTCSPNYTECVAINTVQKAFEKFLENLNG